MLELMLLRHAKSRWDAAGVDDHDRDLTERGEKAAKRMGRLIRDRDLAPDLVLTSTATRARRTVELALATLDPAPSVKELRKLYLAAPGRLLEIVRRQEQMVRRLMIVAHDPGMHALALRLMGEADTTHRDRLQEKMPTAALALFRFEGPTWDGVSEAGGRLTSYWVPRDLE